MSNTAPVLEEPPKREIRATLNARGNDDQVYYWRLGGGNVQFVSFGTINVSFAETKEDNFDILPSRAVEQEVLDMLDEPPAR